MMVEMTSWTPAFAFRIPAMKPHSAPPMMPAMMAAAR
jgi:hypothetical protein